MGRFSEPNRPALRGLWNLIFKGFRNLTPTLREAFWDLPREEPNPDAPRRPFPVREGLMEIIVGGDG